MTDQGNVVPFGKYKGRLVGATREQFIKTFATAGIKVVFRERGLIEHTAAAASAES